jgi:hypothetical protein
MPTLPRHCLVGFADYKQKNWDVNEISQPTLILIASKQIKEASGEFGRVFEQPNGPVVDLW